MFWIITKDHFGDTQMGTGRYTGEKLAAIRDPKLRQEATDRFVAARPEFNFEFQLLDDDRNLCYTGRYMALDDADQDAAFEPLDWAMPHAGCTIMQYRRVGATKWEDL
ncbi:TPA: hypothetical protein QDA74_003717 [Burkholderia territorii]|uniref:hypothetical protein n=1 Tax=Burkholderia territorii TaxID=1503055 RepID=UPI0011C76124|nr:hypothetical protein [Burkholderia territorii]TXG07062.1 hypothetical protein FU139_25460 [Burkholderia territorii]HDR8859219.1 hypothetical protein [Burkholderia territorii]HDR8866204.1 hypothetical protein [Burkholderia territorii]HDR8872308.1 hypothetical protein [Burkholderia territorii]HDR8878206.1 hypothetical protein [Burkholderia territorii]